MFPCFGIQTFGQCAYNPGAPSGIYFSIGDAISALGFTLAVQQLIKPVYLFRLQAFRLRIAYMSIAVFLGAGFSFIGLIVANIDIQHKTAWSYPIIWEFAGGAVVALTYAIAVTASLTRARVYSFNVKPFIRAAAHLLSSSSDDDRISFAYDLIEGQNINRLIRLSSAWDEAERHSTSVEFERLQSLGAKLQIKGRPPISAFYRFSHRRQLENATFAATFLELLSDADFCSVLVRRCPWLTAFMLQQISDLRLHTSAADKFIQEIAYQAIINDDSILTKEISYIGFRVIPMLSNSLFMDFFVLRNFDPLNKIGFVIPDLPSPGFIKRLSSAVNAMFVTAVKNDDFWPRSYIHSAADVFERLFRAKL